MKNPDLNIILTLCLVWWSMSGCIHSYPDGEGVDPTLLQVGVELSVDIDWQPIGASLTKASGVSADHRLLIEFSRNGKLHGRCEHRIPADEYAEGKIRLIMPFDFNAVEYTVTAWLDCVDNSPTFESNSCFYNASSLSEIKRADNHISWAEEAECAFASTSINLEEYRDRWNAKVVVPLSLYSPIARFEFVATDFDKFYDYVSDKVNRGETYSVCLAFECMIATAFNAKKDEASIYLTSPEYNFPFPIPDTPASFDGKIISASAFVSDKPQTLKAKVLIFNSARMIISKSPSMEFPIERGKLTTVTGDMISDFYTGSFDINNIWDGEIIIEL